MPFDSATRTLATAILRRCAPLLAIQTALTILFCITMQNINLSLGDRSAMSRSDIRQLIGDGSEGLLISFLIIGVNLLFAVGTILLQYSDSGQLRARFPVRIYLLPISFRRLVFVHIIEGSLLVATVMSMATYCANRFFDAPFSMLQILALSIFVVAVLQTWSIGVGGPRRNLFGSIALIVLVAIPFTLVRNETFATTLTSIPSVALFAASILLMLGLAEVVVRLSHTNRSRSFDGTSSKTSKDAASKNRGKPFMIPTRAQAWYEWRIVGWILPALSVTLLVIYFMGIPMLTALFISATDTRTPMGESYGDRFGMHWAKNQHIVSTGLLTVAIGAGVLTGAYMFLISGEWRQRSTFLKTRPMSTPKLAGVRMRVLLTSCLVSTSMLITVFLAMGEYMKRIHPDFETLFYIRQGYEHLPDAFVLLFFAGTLFILMWSGLWIVNLGAYLGILGSTMALAFVMSLAARAAIDGEISGGIGWLISRGPIWTTTVLWILGCLTLYRRAHRQRLFPNWSRPTALGAWCIYTAAFITYGLAIRYYASYVGDDGVIRFREVVTDMSLVNRNAIPFTHPVDWVLWTGLSLLPILPIAALPFRLESMRRE